MGATLPQLVAMKTNRVDPLEQVVFSSLREGAARPDRLNARAAVVAVVEVVETATALSGLEGPLQTDPLGFGDQVDKEADEK